MSKVIEGNQLHTNTRNQTGEKSEHDWETHSTHTNTKTDTRKDGQAQTQGRTFCMDL